MAEREVVIRVTSNLLGAEKAEQFLRNFQKTQQNASRYAEAYTKRLEANKKIVASLAKGHTDVANQMSRTINPIQKLGLAYDRLTQKVNALKLSIAGLIGAGGIAWGRRVYSLGMQFQKSLDQSLARLTAEIRRDNENWGKARRRAEDLIKWGVQYKIKTPYSLDQIMESLSSFALLYRGDIERAKRATQVAALLASKNPRQGLTGAMIALQEAETGYMLSPVRRFNLPKNILERYYRQTGSGLEAIEKTLKELRVTEDLMFKVTDTLPGLEHQVQNMYRMIYGEVMEGIFKARREHMRFVRDRLKAMLTERGEVKEIIQMTSNLMGTATKFYYTIVEAPIRFADRWLPVLRDFARVFDPIVANIKAFARGIYQGIVLPLKAMGITLKTIGAIIHPIAKLMGFGSGWIGKILGLPMLAGVPLAQAGGTMVGLMTSFRIAGLIKNLIRGKGVLGFAGNQDNPIYGKAGGLLSPEEIKLRYYRMGVMEPPEIPPEELRRFKKAVYEARRRARERAEGLHPALRESYVHQATEEAINRGLRRYLVKPRQEMTMPTATTFLALQQQKFVSEFARAVREFRLTIEMMMRATTRIHMGDTRVVGDLSQFVGPNAPGGRFAGLRGAFARTMTTLAKAQDFRHYIETSPIFQAMRWLTTRRSVETETDEAGNARKVVKEELHPFFATYGALIEGRSVFHNIATLAGAGLIGVGRMKGIDSLGSLGQRLVSWGTQPHQIRPSEITLADIGNRARQAMAAAFAMALGRGDIANKFLEAADMADEIAREMKKIGVTKALGRVLSVFGKKTATEKSTGSGFKIDVKTGELITEEASKTASTIGNILGLGGILSAAKSFLSKQVASTGSVLKKAATMTTGSPMLMAAVLGGGTVIYLMHRRRARATARQQNLRPEDIDQSLGYASGLVGPSPIRRPPEPTVRSPLLKFLFSWWKLPTLKSRIPNFGQGDTILGYIPFGQRWHSGGEYKPTIVGEPPITKYPLGEIEYEREKTKSMFARITKLLLPVTKLAAVAGIIYGSAKLTPLITLITAALKATSPVFWGMLTTGLATGLIFGRRAKREALGYASEGDWKKLAIGMVKASVIGGIGSALVGAGAVGLAADTLSRRYLKTPILALIGEYIPMAMPLLLGGIAISTIVNVTKRVMDRLGIADFRSIPTVLYDRTEIRSGKLGRWAGMLLGGLGGGIMGGAFGGGAGYLLSRFLVRDPRLRLAIALAGALYGGYRSGKAGAQWMGDIGETFGSFFGKTTLSLLLTGGLGMLARRVMPGGIAGGIGKALLGGIILPAIGRQAFGDDSWAASPILGLLSAFAPGLIWGMGTKPFKLFGPLAARLWRFGRNWGRTSPVAGWAGEKISGIVKWLIGSRIGRSTAKGFRMWGEKVPALRGILSPNTAKNLGEVFRRTISVVDEAAEAVMKAPGGPSVWARAAGVMGKTLKYGLIGSLIAGAGALTYWVWRKFAGREKRDQTGAPIEGGMYPGGGDSGLSIKGIPLRSLALAIAAQVIPIAITTLPINKVLRNILPMFVGTALTGYAAVQPMGLEALAVGHIAGIIAGFFRGGIIKRLLSPRAIIKEAGLVKGVLRWFGVFIEGLLGPDVWELVRKRIFPFIARGFTRLFAPVFKRFLPSIGAEAAASIPLFTTLARYGKNLIGGAANLGKKAVGLAGRAAPTLIGATLPFMNRAGEPDDWYATEQKAMDAASAWRKSGGILGRTLGGKYTPNQLTGAGSLNFSVGTQATTSPSNQGDTNTPQVVINATYNLSGDVDPKKIMEVLEKNNSHLERLVTDSVHKALTR